MTYLEFNDVCDRLRPFLPVNVGLSMVQTSSGFDVTVLDNVGWSLTVSISDAKADALSSATSLKGIMPAHFAKLLAKGPGTVFKAPPT